MAAGTHTIYAKTTDSAGNSSECSSSSLSYTVSEASNITSNNRDSISQVSTSGSHHASRAVDDNYTNYTHTSAGPGSPHYLTFNFVNDRLISKIVIYNRTNCCKARLRDLDIVIKDSAGNVVYQYSDNDFAGTYLNAGNSDYLLSATNNSTSLGPTSLTLNLLEDSPIGAGGPVEGQTIIIYRHQDLNYRSTYSGENNDDKNVLSIGELEIWGELE